MQSMNSLVLIPCTSSFRGWLAGSEIPMLKIFMQAAKETGVKYIVYLSAMDATGDEFNSKVHNHYEHVQLLFKSGIPATALRPKYFHENIVNFQADNIKRSGEFRTSAGDGVWMSVSVRDIAAAAFTVLTNPEEHVGKSYILEEELLTDQLLAEKISKVTGKKVPHVNLTPEEHVEMLSNFVPAEVATLLASLDKNKRESRFNVVRTDLERLLGRKGVTVDEVLAANADAFYLIT